MIEAKLDIKPIPVPSIYQPIYKLIMLLAILKYGSRRPYNCTYLKLHMYLWGLRSVDNYYSLLKLKKPEIKSILPWSYESGLSRLVTLALINNYCVRAVKSNELQIQLTEAGIDLISRIEELGLFKEDIMKIKKIGIISQTKIKEASTNWSLNL